jgi:hypothetical protein
MIIGRGLHHHIHNRTSDTTQCRQAPGSEPRAHAYIVMPRRRQNGTPRAGRKMAQRRGHGSRWQNPHNTVKAIIGAAAIKPSSSELAALFAA